MNCIHKSGNMCKALRDKKCTDCKFEISAEQNDVKKIKHDIRLNSLSAKAQQAIADKYYGGITVWQM